MVSFCWGLVSTDASAQLAAVSDMLWYPFFCKSLIGCG